MQTLESPTSTINNISNTCTQITLQYAYSPTISHTTKREQTLQTLTNITQILRTLYFWRIFNEMPYVMNHNISCVICDISYAFSNYEYYLHPSTKYLVLELEQLMDLGSLDANADIFHSGYGCPPFLSCYFITTMLQSHFTI